MRSLVGQSLEQAPLPLTIMSSRKDKSSMEEPSFTLKVLLAATLLPTHIHLTYHQAPLPSCLLEPISRPPSKFTRQILATSAPIPSHYQTPSQSTMARARQPEYSAVSIRATESKYSRVITRFYTLGSWVCSRTITGQTRPNA